MVGRFHGDFENRDMFDSEHQLVGRVHRSGLRIVISRIHGWLVGSMATGLIFETYFFQYLGWLVGSIATQSFFEIYFFRNLGWLVGSMVMLRNGIASSQNTSW